MTPGDFFSNCDAGDPLKFFSYYGPSLIIAFLTIVLLSVVLVCTRSWKPKYIFISTIFIVCCWMVYFFSTASQNMTLALLGSESPEAAEFAFQKDFKLHLNQAIRLATRDRGQDDIEGQTVRFYAACRIADIMQSSNHDFQNKILNQVQDASIVTPTFIGTNSINFIFGDPNRGQPRVTVSEIIQRRLSELGKR
jgi:hypothetical protein